MRSRWPHAHSALQLIALEIDEYFKHLAAPFFAKAGVADIIDVRVGPALESVQAMAGTEEPFDLIFIDADKTGYHDYYETIMSSGLLAKGGVLLVDNTLYKVSAAEPLLPAGPLTRSLRRACRSPKHSARPRRSSWAICSSMPTTGGRSRRSTSMSTTTHASRRPCCRSVTA